MTTPSLTGALYSHNSGEASLRRHGGYITQITHGVHSAKPYHVPQSRDRAPLQFLVASKDRL